MVKFVKLPVDFLSIARHELCTCVLVQWFIILTHFDLIDFRMYKGGMLKWGSSGGGGGGIEAVNMCMSCSAYGWCSLAP